VLGRLIINEVVETGLASSMPLDDVSKVINGDVGRAVKSCTHGSDLDCLDRLYTAYLDYVYGPTAHGAQPVTNAVKTRVAVKRGI